MIETNIIYFLRCRELNLPFRGKIVVLSRPNFDEDFWWYNDL
tara:strand:+ start:1077 stop:1202 length:126 start_codon:yes stop_codon:yes gene_type:complete